MSELPDAVDRVAGTPGSAGLIALEERYGARNYAPLDVVLSRGEGVWVWDLEGRCYLDCLSAYSAVNQGHCHPKILAALTRQAGQLTLTGRAFHNDQLGLFYQELAELTGSTRVLPMNSGAEAVESAIKVARKWAYQHKKIANNQAEIVVCGDNFHGRTISVVSFSTDEDSRNEFGPFTPGFRVVPFGDAEAMRDAIGPDTAAVLLEPIQGEAGVIIPPDGYLRAVRDLCDEHNVLMILDEIQTGLGRTGRLLAEEHDGVVADMTLVGKALGGGFYPVSAVLSNNAALGTLRPGEHGSTFGGNPLACAVARAALRVLVEEDMIGNADRVGRRLLRGLQRADLPGVREVRGRGLMLAIELDTACGGAKPFIEALRDTGLLCKDTHQHIIRLSPPLVLTEQEADWIVEQVCGVFKSRH